MPSALLHINYTLDLNQTAHQREVYSFLDFVSDIGGVFDLIILAVGFFFKRISEFSFKLKFIQKMYRIKKKDMSKQNKLKY